MLFFEYEGSTPSISTKTMDREILQTIRSVRNFYHTDLITETTGNVVFNLKLPLNRYIQDDSIDDDLNLYYATRDMATAEEQAEALLLFRLGLPTFPLSINLEAQFKHIDHPSVIYQITVSGDNTTFLKSVRSLNL